MKIFLVLLFILINGSAYAQSCNELDIKFIGEIVFKNEKKNLYKVYHEEIPSEWTHHGNLYGRVFVKAKKQYLSLVLGEKRYDLAAKDKIGQEIQKLEFSKIVSEKDKLVFSLYSKDKFICKKKIKVVKEQ